IDVGAMAQGAYGLNLVIGTQQQVRETLSSAYGAAVHALPASILPPRDGFRATIVVTGENETDIAQALTRLNMATQLRGSTAGLRSARALPGYRIEGVQRVKLRDLGLASQEFSGRLFRAEFNLIMPPDFYAADYGKATLDLAGGYAP